MKNAVKYILALTLSLFCSLSARTQNFSLLTLPTQQQLPTATIHCLIQDSEGYMWYGTERGGLYRDNGYQIDVFRPSDIGCNAKANHILCITEMRNGQILAGTPEGLFLINKQNYTITQTTIDSIRIEALFTDSKGTTWIGTDRSILKLGTDLSIIRTFPSVYKGEIRSVTRFFEDHGGRLFALQWQGGILIKDKNTENFLPMEWNRPSWPTQMVEDEENQCYWLATWGDGIIKMHLKEKKCQTEVQEATQNSYGRQRGFDLIRDKHQGLLWMSTPDDLYAYSIADGRLKRFDTDKFLPKGKKIIDQMLENRDGCIYVAGYTPHTFIICPVKERITRLDIPTMTALTGYPLLADRSIIDNDFIWIWQGRMGLSLFHTKDQSLKFTDWKTDRCIQKNSSEGKGLWGSHGQTLYRIQQNQGTIEHHTLTNVPNGQSIRHIVDDNQGHLYIATQTYLYRYTIAGGQMKQIATLPSHPIDMTVTTNGNLYLIFEEKGLRIITKQGDILQPQQPEEHFTALAASPDGTVWLTALNGNVYHYFPSDRQMKRVDFLHNRNEAPLRDITVDGMGHVWTVSDQKIVECNPNTMAFRIISAADPQIKVDYFYGIENTDASHLCINGAGAICLIESSAALNQAGTLVQPMVSACLIDGCKQIIGRQTKEIKLNPDHTTLNLYLTTLNHTATDKIVFAYKLKGLHTDWIYGDVGQNTLYFNHLSKGHYQLEVMATDRNGCWGEPATILTIISLPHWYETWWARLLYVAIIILTIGGIWRMEQRISLLHRLIQRRRHVKLDEIELKREDISSDHWNDEFIRRAIAKVEENLSRTDYNVETLSTDMCMSRSTFYRRLQELTGQSPTDFIRDIRLKKAATLLRQDSHATISDIARKVGFSSPKYFSKCFREKFGVLPKDFNQEPNEKAKT